MFSQRAPDPVISHPLYPLRFTCFLCHQTFKNVFSDPSWTPSKSIGPHTPWGSELAHVCLFDHLRTPLRDYKKFSARNAQKDRFENRLWSRPLGVLPCPCPCMPSRDVTWDSLLELMRIPMLWASKGESGFTRSLRASLDRIIWVNFNSFLTFQFILNIAHLSSRACRNFQVRQFDFMTTFPNFLFWIAEINGLVLEPWA